MSLKSYKLSVSPVSKALLAVAAIAFVVAIYFWVGLGSSIKNDRYQLVKLTTGEMFFGKLKNTSGEYLQLQDAYFIPATTVSENTATSETEILSRKATVAKSDSPMYIKSSTVSYWENLASDSKIANTIKDDLSE